MSNEELKKKIIEILEETEYEWTEEKNGYILQIFYSKLADALIAAGLKFDTVVSHTATFDTMQQDRINELEKRIAEAEHRAERAERALLLACAKMVKDEKDDVNIELLVGVIYRKYLKQAEEALAEERE